MYRSALEERVEHAEAVIATAVAGLDPDLVPASEASRVFDGLERIVRTASAARTLLARRVEDSEEWKRLGYASPADHLAAKSGTSIGAAKTSLDTSNALKHLPEIRSSLLDGAISPAQGDVIAGAAQHNPHAQMRLLERARSGNMRELRGEAAKVKAEADPDPDATHHRLHRERRATRHTDDDGARQWHLRAPVDELAEFEAEIDRLTDLIFRERRKGGDLEPRDAYALDAAAEMARRSRRADDAPATGKARSPKPTQLALLRLDISALWRGHVEGDELCEITGLGPIPVKVAKRLLGEAVLKLIITNGVHVAHVTSLTRGPTQAMRYAHLWTSPTCSVEGCSRTIIEYDHVYGAEYKHTRHTRLDETAPVCPGHHDLHTKHGWALLPGVGQRPMVPPDDPRHPAHRLARRAEVAVAPPAPARSSPPISDRARPREHTTSPPPGAPRRRPTREFATDPPGPADLFGSSAA